MIPDATYYFPGMRITQFLIKKGDKIPLHGHPDQYGLLFVLEGKCSIKKYKILSRDDERYTIQIIDERVLINNEHSVITPVNNIHTLVAEEDTKLLDIFAPGVASGRLSEFLKILSEDDSNNYLTVAPIDISLVEMADYLKDSHGHKIIIKD